MLASIGQSKKNWSNKEDDGTEVLRETSPWFRGETAVACTHFNTNVNWEMHCHCEDGTKARCDRTNKKTINFTNPILNPQKILQLPGWLQKKIKSGSCSQPEKVGETWQAEFNTCGKFYWTCGKPWDWDREHEDAIKNGSVEKRCGFFGWHHDHPQWVVLKQAEEAEDKESIEYIKTWHWTLGSVNDYEKDKLQPEIIAEITKQLQQPEETKQKTGYNGKKSFAFGGAKPSKSPKSNIATDKKLA